jgi:hypothetical protein
MTEKELAERIIDEAQNWTQKQFTLTPGVPGPDSASEHDARARIELIEHIKQTYKEMRENA